MKSIINYNDVANGYGLLGGKMGHCLVYFILSENNNINLNQKAQDILNEITENIGEVDSFNFKDGLAGIGFGIEWLSQNNYIKINTDEILEEIDDELYKSLIYAKNNCYDLEYGALGNALYFYKRFKAKNLNQNRYNRICINECLVMLSDEILDYLINLINNINFNNIAEKEILTLAQILILFGKIYSSAINLSTVEIGIVKIVDFFMGINDNRFNGCYVYLLYALGVTGYELKDINFMHYFTISFKKYINSCEYNNNKDNNILIYYLLNRLKSMYNLDIEIVRPTSECTMYESILVADNDSLLPEIWLLR